MHSGLHHIHKRKRVHENLEKYPHDNKWIRFLDKFLIVVAIIGPFMSLPQLWNIYVGHSAEGVSALTFSLFALINIPWLIYGFVHDSKPIKIAYTLWLIMNAAVAVGAMVYS